MIRKVKEGQLDSSRASEVFSRMQSAGESSDEAIAELGIEQVDEAALVELCRELLEANPRVVADLKEGKMKAVGALVGQAKKKNPNVNPGRVREICVELAASM